jgi:anti-anti-sigma regulatory factor
MTPTVREVAMGGIHVNTTGTLDVITMSAYGEIGTDNAADLRRLLVEVIMHRRPSRLIIDLDAVTAVDAAVIGTLRAAHATAQDMDLNIAFRTSGSPISEQLHNDGISHTPVAVPHYSPA